MVRLVSLPIDIIYFKYAFAKVVFSDTEADEKNKSQIEFTYIVLMNKRSSIKILVKFQR